MILTFDEQTSLVDKKLATVSKNGNLWTFKYARKVMFDYLWDKHPELKECRGHTYDAYRKQIVLVTPTKSFNYLEKDTWKDKSLQDEVWMYKKYNGFMASATVYKNEVLVGTTGSTKSDFAEVAKKHIMQSLPELPLSKANNFTWLFEIIDENDPHIVDEGEPRAVYLGGRVLGKPFYPVGDKISCTLTDALELSKTDKGEGWMVYNPEDMSDMCKLKTDYYVGKKKLMRLSKRNSELMYNQARTIENQLPERWKFVVDRILKEFSLEQWLQLQEQQRRVYLESIYE